jgi:hypothetical protein
VDGRDKPGHDDVTRPAREKFAIMRPLTFVDWIFTSLFERLFTKAFDAARVNGARTCV